MRDARKAIERYVDASKGDSLPLYCWIAHCHWGQTLRAIGEDCGFSHTTARKHLQALGQELKVKPSRAVKRDLFMPDHLEDCEKIMKRLAKGERAALIDFQELRIHPGLSKGKRKELLAGPGQAGNYADPATVPDDEEDTGLDTSDLVFFLDALRTSSQGLPRRLFAVCARYAGWSNGTTAKALGNTPQAVGRLVKRAGQDDMVLGLLLDGVRLDANELLAILDQLYRSADEWYQIQTGFIDCSKERRPDLGSREDRHFWKHVAVASRQAWELDRHAKRLASLHGLSWNRLRTPSEPRIAPLLGHTGTIEANCRASRLLCRPGM